MPVCADCGMPVDKATTYHPYAACLMFKACQNSDVVQANLDAVVFHGMEPVSKDAMRYRWLRDTAVRLAPANKRGEMVWCVIGKNAMECSPCEGDELDSEVDAAMLKTPNGGGQRSDD